MKDIIISMSYIESIYIKDCNCNNFNIIDTYIENIEFEDEFLTKFNENTFIGKIDINES